MSQTREQLRQRIEKLQAERDILAEELEELRAGKDPEADLAAWVAWDEAEAFLADLVKIEATDEAAALAASLQRQASVLSPRAGTTPEQALEERRRRLLQVRDGVKERDRRLLELQRQKDEILSIVAHDLRTPLVAIQGFAQLLKLSSRTTGLAPKQEEYVERIFQAIRSMNLLVDDLLTTRRLEQGRLTLRARTARIPDFLEGLLDVHGETARQKGVQIRVECPVEVPALVFDPDRLGQALGNLVQNAVKFTPQGKRVTLGVLELEEYLRFEVSDQGPGIDESLLPRLFDRFAQGRIAETAGRGYGLGLYICREIALLHGGRVGAENLPEGGSRFWVELPLIPVVVPDEEGAPEA